MSVQLPAFFLTFFHHFSFMWAFSQLFLDRSWTKKKQTSTDYAQIDRWIESCSDADRENILKQLSPFKYLVCYSNSPEWWWRYAIGQYFGAIALYEKDAGKKKRFDNQQNAYCTGKYAACGSLQFNQAPGHPQTVSASVNFLLPSTITYICIFS